MPRISRVIRHLTQPYTVRDIKASTLICYPGTQAFTALPHIEPQMLADMRGRLNIYDNIASTASVAANGNTQQPYAGQEAKSVFSSYTSKMQFTNNSTIPVELTIYDVSPKRDLSATMFYEGPVINGATQQTLQWAGNPISCLQTYQAESTGVFGAPAYPPKSQSDMNAIQNGYQRWGFNPMQSALFRAYFTIRSRSIMMQPGGTHDHLVSLRPNTVLDNLKLRSMNMGGTSNMQAYAGITKWTMLRVRGLKAISQDGKYHTTAAGRIDIDCDRVRVGRIFRRLMAKTVNLSARDYIAPKVALGACYTQHVNAVRGTVIGDNFIAETTNVFSENQADGEDEAEEQFRTNDIEPEYVDYGGETEPVLVGAGDTINEDEVTNHGTHGPQSPQAPEEPVFNPGTE